MKNIFCIIFFMSLHLFNPTYAQKLMKVVYIKDGAVTTNPKEADLLIAIRSVNGRYERNDYTMNGPLKRVKTFKDLNQTILEGNYLEYDKEGNLQLAGYYTDNKKSGSWLYFNDSGNVVKTENFDGPGIFQETGSNHDSSTAPSFKGGKKEWGNYIHETLDRDAMVNMLKDEEVKISFTVTESGTLKDFILFKSEYFTIDNEIIRVFSKSPKWKPATYAGKPVSYRYRQSMTILDLFHEDN